MRQKVLQTKAVYKAQKGIVIAEEIADVLTDFGIFDKIVAVTVDNAANMDVAIHRLQFVKLGCFAHTLNLAAQSLYSLAIMSQWIAKIRALVVWIKRSSMAKTVLQEKQAILKLPQHSLILDVRTRWNSLHLMLERFLEQYPAIQAASLDQRLRKPMERDRLARFTDEDLRRAEDFIRLMRVMYTSTLCVSSEKNPTSGQILPILKKLEMHFTVTDGDTKFLAKNLTDSEKSTDLDCGGDGDENMEGMESEAEENVSQMHPCKTPKMTPLEELFADEDAQKVTPQQNSMSIQDQVEKELHMYA
ncbi:hypothetical protein JOQ06_013128 [Pogonophryne albipinna]|uniref:Uncharacterized protein n=1 Tax=Pogonophryne albipinna TaxID=1090488 RepID=A0AAD6FSV2_9TELE|nr:hypothetical protein JOQ06_013128 [Pogonophryne albipinna]